MSDRQQRDLLAVSLSQINKKFPVSLGPQQGGLGHPDCFQLQGERSLPDLFDDPELLVMGADDSALSYFPFAHLELRLDQRNDLTVRGE